VPEHGPVPEPALDSAPELVAPSLRCAAVSEHGFGAGDLAAGAGWVVEQVPLFVAEVEGLTVAVVAVAVAAVAVAAAAVAAAVEAAVEVVAGQLARLVLDGSLLMEGVVGLAEVVMLLEVLDSQTGCGYLTETAHVAWQLLAAAACAVADAGVAAAVVALVVVVAAVAAAVVAAAVAAVAVVDVAAAVVVLVAVAAADAVAAVAAVLDVQLEPVPGQQLAGDRRPVGLPFAAVVVAVANVVATEQTAAAPSVEPVVGVFAVGS
jgi:hypothetical protein